MLQDKKCMVHFKAWVYRVSVYVCVQLSIHNRLFPPSIWPFFYSSSHQFGPSAPGHSSTLPPCIYIHTSLPPVCFLSLHVSSHSPSCLTFLQSRNRSGGNGRVIADSPPASASLGRCLFASRRVVTLSNSLVPPYLT